MSLSWEAGSSANGSTHWQTGGGAAQSFTGTYSIGADNRGVMTFNFSGSSARLAFAMMANGNAQLIEFDASGGAGLIGSGTMEKNPTSVVGGAQSSTGTVTLSGAAPSGGAVVALSSNNTGAARVPSSVTVAAGATSATFKVSTSAVAASTTVAISGAYQA